ncbi:MAG: peroxide stress protein YaaA [Actinomycetes bacterium]
MPPSEGKTDGISKKPLNLKKLSFPQLTPQREVLLAAVVAMANGPVAKTRSILSISAKQDFEILRDQQLVTAATGPAWSVYTGVLYDAIGIASLSTTAKAKFEKENFVVSALFGLISAADLIPAYRLSGDTVVPKIGTLGKYWGNSITNALGDRSDFLIDLRSGNYLKLGATPAALADQVVVPRIMQHMPKGAPKVVSHSNKASKGRIVRALAESQKSVSSVEELANIVAKVSREVQILKPKKAGLPWGLDVIVDAL